MISRSLLWRVGFAILISAAAVLAADPALGPANPSTSPLPSPALTPLTTAPVDSSMGGAVVRLFGAFTLVITLFLGAVWLWKYWQRTAGAGGRWARLQVLEARSLGNRQSIFVVGYENERLLLGSSPQGVTLLTRLPESTDALDRAPSESPAAGKFADVLMGVLNSRR